MKNLIDNYGNAPFGGGCISGVESGGDVVGILQGKGSKQLFDIRPSGRCIGYDDTLEKRMVAML